MVTITTFDKKRLRAVLARIATNEFKYGVLDCCLFAARMVQASTGIDYSKKFEYSSRKEAQQIIDSYGSITAMLTDLLGEPSSDYGDGDPVLLDLPGSGETVGIFCDGKVFVKCLSGVMKIESNNIIRGWALCHKQS